VRNNILLITGGTAGHVIPSENLGNFLLSKNRNCVIISDKRGNNYINNFNGKLYLINSSNLNGNIIKKLIGLCSLILGFFQSLFIVLYFKPSKVISFGSYASFAPMLCCTLLKSIYKIDIYIHEQNSIIGRTNKFFLKYCNKLFLNFDIISKISIRYLSRTHVVGLPEKHLQADLSKKIKFEDQMFSICILGGSQGSEFISKFALNLIKIIEAEKKINIKFIFQSPKHLIDEIKTDLEKIQSKFIIDNYFHDVDELLENTSLMISRSGAGTIRNLIDYSIPSILIPLPSAKDNHQFENASILVKHDVAIIIDQKNINYNKAKNYIYEIYNNKKKVMLIREKLDKIKVKNSNSLIYKLIDYEK